MTDEDVHPSDDPDNPHQPYDISKYTTIEDANITLNNSKNASELSVLYINIVSLSGNIDDLTNFLAEFDNNPDLILLSETKITDKVNTNYIPHLDNYTYRNMPSKTFFGSTGVFFHNSLVPTFRNDLSCSEKGLYEMLWFDITSKKRKSTFGIVYRHTGTTDIPSFTNRLEKIVRKLNSEKNNFYIFGDYNINLFDTETYNISEFANTMFSHNVVNLINKATRFPIGAQWGSPSLLDHVWTNQPLLVKNIDMIVNPISDHRPTLVTLQEKFDTNINNGNFTFKRDFKNFDPEAFNRSLGELSSNDLSAPNVHEKFQLLQFHIRDPLINMHLLGSIRNASKNLKQSPGSHKVY